MYCENTMEKAYIDAIKCCNKHIREDDRILWWPKILRIEEGNVKIHEINCHECSVGYSDYITDF